MCEECDRLKREEERAILALALALSMATAARGSDLPGVTTAHILEEMMIGYEECLADPKTAVVKNRRDQTGSVDFERGAETQVATPCSSLGRLRYAVLLQIGKRNFSLVDIKEAVKAAAPRSGKGRMPTNDGLSGAESEPEFVRGALGTDGERRVPVEADSVRGRFDKAGTSPIRSALSRRTQPPRQGQRSIIPMWRSADDEARVIDPLSRTPRRSSQVLPPKGRMRFLAIRVRLWRRFLLLASCSQQVARPLVKAQHPPNKEQGDDGDHDVAHPLRFPPSYCGAEAPLIRSATLFARSALSTT